MLLRLRFAALIGLSSVGAGSEEPTGAREGEDAGILNGNGTDEGREDDVNGMTGVATNDLGVATEFAGI